MDRDAVQPYLRHRAQSSSDRPASRRNRRPQIMAGGREPRAPSLWLRRQACSPPAISIPMDLSHILSYQRAGQRRSAKSRSFLDLPPAAASSLDNRKFPMAAGRDPKELILLFALPSRLRKTAGHVRPTPPPPKAQTAVFQDGGIVLDEDARPRMSQR